MNRSNDSDNDSINTEILRSRMWDRDDERSDTASTVTEHDTEHTSLVSTTDTDGIHTNETSDTSTQSPNTPSPSQTPNFVQRIRHENIQSTGTQNSGILLPPESAFNAFSEAMATESPPIPSHAPSPTSGIVPFPPSTTRFQLRNALQRHNLDDAAQQTPQQALSQQTSRSPRTTPSGSRDGDTAADIREELEATREMEEEATRVRLEAEEQLQVARDAGLRLERRAAELTAELESLRNEVAVSEARILSRGEERALRRGLATHADITALQQMDIQFDWGSDSDSIASTANTPPGAMIFSPRDGAPIRRPTPRRQFSTPSPLTSRQPPIVNRGRRASTVDEDEIVGPSLFNVDTQSMSDPFLGIPAPPAVASSAIGVVNVDDTGYVMHAEADEYEEAPITPTNTPPRGVSRPSPMHSPAGTRANIIPPINNNSFIGFYGEVFENNTTEDYIRINNIENETPIATHLNKYNWFENPDEEFARRNYWIRSGFQFSGCGKRILFYSYNSQYIHDIDTPLYDRIGSEIASNWIYDSNMIDTSGNLKKEFVLTKSIYGKDHKGNNIIASHYYDTKNEKNLLYITDELSITINSIPQRRMEQVAPVYKIPDNLFPHPTNTAWGQPPRIVTDIMFSNQPTLSSTHRRGAKFLKLLVSWDNGDIIIYRCDGIDSTARSNQFTIISSLIGNYSFQNFGGLVNGGFSFNNNWVVTKGVINNDRNAAEPSIIVIRVWKCYPDGTNPLNVRNPVTGDGTMISWDDNWYNNWEIRWLNDTSVPTSPKTVKNFGDVSFSPRDENILLISSAKSGTSGLSPSVYLVRTPQLNRDEMPSTDQRFVSVTVSGYLWKHNPFLLTTDYEIHGAKFSSDGESFFVICNSARELSVDIYDLRTVDTYMSDQRSLNEELRPIFRKHYVLLHYRRIHDIQLRPPGTQGAHHRRERTGFNSPVPSHRYRSITQSRIIQHQDAIEPQDFFNIRKHIRENDDLQIPTINFDTLIKPIIFETIGDPGIRNEHLETIQSLVRFSNKFGGIICGDFALYIAEMSMGILGRSWTPGPSTRRTLRTRPSNIQLMFMIPEKLEHEFSVNDTNMQDIIDSFVNFFDKIKHQFTRYQPDALMKRRFLNEYWEDCGYAHISNITNFDSEKCFSASFISKHSNKDEKLNLFINTVELIFIYNRYDYHDLIQNLYEWRALHCFLKQNNNDTDTSVHFLNIGVKNDIRKGILTSHSKEIATPQPRLPDGWQPNLPRLLSNIVPMLSEEQRHVFREFVKDLKEKRDAGEISSLSEALMEQVPSVVGADLWQQCIDIQRKEALLQPVAPVTIKMRFPYKHFLNNIDKSFELIFKGYSPLDVKDFIEHQKLEFFKNINKGHEQSHHRIKSLRYKVDNYEEIVEFAKKHNLNKYTERIANNASMNTANYNADGGQLILCTHSIENSDLQILGEPFKIRYFKYKDSDHLYGINICRNNNCRKIVSNQDITFCTKCGSEFFPDEFSTNTTFLDFYIEVFQKIWDKNYNEQYYIKLKKLEDMTSIDTKYGLEQKGILLNQKFFLDELNELMLHSGDNPTKQFKNEYKFYEGLTRHNFDTHPLKLQQTFENRRKTHHYNDTNAPLLLYLLKKRTMTSVINSFMDTTSYREQFNKGEGEHMINIFENLLKINTTEWENMSFQNMINKITTLQNDGIINDKTMEILQRIPSFTQNANIPNVWEQFNILMHKSYLRGKFWDIISGFEETQLPYNLFDDIAEARTTVPFSPYSKPFGEFGHTFPINTKVQAMWIGKWYNAIIWRHLIWVVGSDHPSYEVKLFPHPRGANFTGGVLVRKESELRYPVYGDTNVYEEEEEEEHGYSETKEETEFSETKEETEFSETKEDHATTAISDELAKSISTYNLIVEYSNLLKTIIGLHSRTVDTTGKMITHLKAWSSPDNICHTSKELINANRTISLWRQLETSMVSTQSRSNFENFKLIGDQISNNGIYLYLTQGGYNEAQVLQRSPYITLSKNVASFWQNQVSELYAPHAANLSDLTNDERKLLEYHQYDEPVSYNDILGMSKYPSLHQFACAWDKGTIDMWTDNNSWKVPDKSRGTIRTDLFFTEYDFGVGAGESEESKRERAASPTFAAHGDIMDHGGPTKSFFDSLGKEFKKILKDAPAVDYLDNHFFRNIRNYAPEREAEMLYTNEENRTFFQLPLWKRLLFFMILASINDCSSMLSVDDELFNLVFLTIGGEKVKKNAYVPFVKIIYASGLFCKPYCTNNREQNLKILCRIIKDNSECDYIEQANYNKIAEEMGMDKYEDIFSSDINFNRDGILIDLIRNFTNNIHITDDEIKGTPEAAKYKKEFLEGVVENFELFRMGLLYHLEWLSKDNYFDDEMSAYERRIGFLEEPRHFVFRGNVYTDIQFYLNVIPFTKTIELNSEYSRNAIFSMFQSAIRREELRYFNNNVQYVRAIHRKINEHFMEYIQELSIKPEIRPTLEDFITFATATVAPPPNMHFEIHYDGIIRNTSDGREIRSMPTSHSCFNQIIIHLPIINGHPEIPDYDVFKSLLDESILSSTENEQFDSSSHDASDPARSPFDATIIEVESTQLGGSKNWFLNLFV